MALERRYELSIDIGPGCPGWAASSPGSGLAGGAVASTRSIRLEGRGGTAILSDPRAEQFFREFAEAAAVRGWLRTNSLELDGKLIAATTAVRSPGPDF
jgi:hypothetical protein